jgi:RNA polymerase sigma-70 factor, ECF subfamily
MDVDPDRELVRGLLSDDPATRRRALGDLYDRHHERVFRTAYKVLGSTTDAADLTQEVFLHMARRIRGFRGDASLTSWVYRVTVNLAIDARRTRARRPARSLTPAPGETTTEPEARTRPGTSGPPSDPVDSSLQHERDEKVRRALDRLSPKLRAVVVLRYFENLSYEELADVLDTSIGTVKSRLNRAHAALERLLAPTAR